MDRIRTHQHLLDAFRRENAPSHKNVRFLWNKSYFAWATTGQSKDASTHNRMHLCRVSGTWHVQCSVSKHPLHLDCFSYLEISYVVWNYTLKWLVVETRPKRVLIKRTPYWFWLTFTIHYTITRCLFYLLIKFCIAVTRTSQKKLHSSDLILVASDNLSRTVFNVYIFFYYREHYSFPLSHLPHPRQRLRPCACTSFGTSTLHLYIVPAWSWVITHTPEHNITVHLALSATSNHQTTPIIIIIVALPIAVWTHAQDFDLKNSSVWGQRERSSSDSVRKARSNACKWMLNAVSRRSRGWLQQQVLAEYPHLQSLKYFHPHLGQFCIFWKPTSQALGQFDDVRLLVHVREGLAYLRHLHNAEVATSLCAACRAEFRTVYPSLNGLGGNFSCMNILLRLWMYIHSERWLFVHRYTLIYT